MCGRTHVVSPHPLTLDKIEVIAAAADPAGSPEKTEIVLAYPQASGVFTPLFVANEAGLFKNMAST